MQNSWWLTLLLGRLPWGVWFDLSFLHARSTTLCACSVTHTHTHTHIGHNAVYMHTYIKFIFSFNHARSICHLSRASCGLLLSLVELFRTLRRWLESFMVCHGQAAISAPECFVCLVCLCWSAKCAVERCASRSGCSLKILASSVSGFHCQLLDFAVDAMPCIYSRSWGHRGYVKSPDLRSAVRLWQNVM